MHNKYLYLLLLSNVLIVLDQATKYMVASHIPLYYSIEVIDGFLNLTHIRNAGVAFGLFADHSSEYKALVFVIVSTVASGAVLFIFYQSPAWRKWVNTGLILIFSGAIGNMIDRVVYKEVIDFIDVYFGNFHWPAFNIADSCITIGVAIMIVDVFLHPHAQPGGPPGKMTKP
jgi:signal peptidase II